MKTMLLAAIAAVFLAGCSDDFFEKAVKPVVEQCKAKNGQFTAQVGTGTFGRSATFTCTFPPGV